MKVSIMKVLCFIYCCMLGGIMTKVTYPNREIYFSCKGIADGEWCWTEDVNTGCWWISNCKHGVCEGNDASGNGNTCTNPTDVVAKNDVLV
ncbi:Hypothetical predicted protein [Mytilus galloprovincialis]|uniref:Uncharacterized protein n=1 Tax=Mytilus galloprovincialis TaxID=29158 RepID=A0A8B6H4V8_MYTGA|nr:Hypothetical predicted protein [Mytilus galloprovincialis]